MRARLFGKKKDQCGFKSGLICYLYQAPFRFGVKIIWTHHRGFFKAHLFCRTRPGFSGLGFAVGKMNKKYSYPMDKFQFYLKSYFPAWENPCIHGEITIPFLGHRAFNMENLR